MRVGKVVLLEDPVVDGNQHLGQRLPVLGAEMLVDKRRRLEQLERGKSATEAATFLLLGVLP